MVDRPNKFIGGQLVPFTDAEMNQLAIDQAALSVPAVPEKISARQFMQQLATQGDITWDECFGYLETGTMPQMFATAIAQIPTTSDPNAQNKAKAAFIGADSFDRHNPTTEILGQLIGKSPADLDALWTAAAAIV